MTRKELEKDINILTQGEFKVFENFNKWNLEIYTFWNNKWINFELKSVFLVEVDEYFYN